MQCDVGVDTENRILAIDSIDSIRYSFALEKHAIDTYN